MKYAFLICAALPYLVSGQGFHYPVIKGSGHQLSDFIPAGWTVLDSAFGDLNKDNFPDMTIVLQFKDSVRVVKDEGSYTDTAITQPRILVILLRDHATQIFRRVAQSNTFILNHDDSDMEDPFQSVQIEQGVLQISFHLFFNIGSWHVTNCSYKFRYQEGSFALIGADHATFHRGTHDYETYSFNFLTRKWSFIQGNDEEPHKPEATWHILELPQLKTLDTFTQPFTWQVIPDLFL